MPNFGPCSEPSCTAIAVRLFDCAHHCMKLVCLQHLIEHDRLINNNQLYLNNLRIELKQLWAAYSSSIDETKLRCEFEEKLKKHQQLIQDITNLFENDSHCIEQYRFMLKKLKQNIEQEKQRNQHSTEFFPFIEQIKIESIDEISTVDELNSLNANLTSCIESKNRNNITSKCRTSNSLSLRKLSGTCPFWYDGAFGLTQKSHGMYLCSREKYHQQLYRHLIKYHQLTLSSAEIIGHAIQNNENPFKKRLFQLNDIVIDQLNHLQCPFSIHNDALLITDKSCEHNCRTVKPLVAHALRYHLIHFHQMTTLNANKIKKKMSELSGQCEDELCLKEANPISIRVFPCLYHCKKMLCIKHLSEHDKYIENQIQFQKQLEHLWNNYTSIFNEDKIKKEFQKLKIKLENYQKLSEDINNVLLINHFHDSMENNQKLQIAIQTVQKAIEQEYRSKSGIFDIHPKTESTMIDEEENQPSIDYGNVSYIDIGAPKFILLADGYGNSIEFENEDNTMEDSSLRDDNRETPKRNISASKIRGYCPLTQDGVFGISCHLHGISLCSRKSDGSQRTYRLHEHFRRVHHLTPLASLTLARAIHSGQDPMTTQLFNEHHIILDIDELRTVICPIKKPFINYPLLHIVNSPCDTIKQVRHLKDHLKRVHKFTNKAANIIVKGVKADAPIHKIQFPRWIDIIEDD
ncbi:unnamed protein product [Rotaria sp. Silwood1]|nr:unnamed protein product [Rotaria sp. Silwood1]